MRRLEAPSVAGGHVVMVGVSHKTASLDVRERLHVGPRSARELASRLASEDGEAVVVSTCNRTEIYLATDGVAEATTRARAELAALTGFDERELRSVLGVLSDGEAAAHLFAVAAGLESLVVGETQILGQVREAHRSALEARASGPVLDRLFRQAVQTGRRVRAETSFLDLPTSVPAATMRLAESLLGSLESVTALVIGAGEMSELVLLNLMHRRCGRILIANRTLAKANRLAARFGAEPLSLECMQDELAVADLVISCSSSTGTILRADDLRRVAAERRGRSLMLLDIAMPRDLDPAIRDLPGCYLYDLDDLGEVVRDSRRHARRELERAQAIVIEETQRFLFWRRSLEVVPAIVSLRRRAEEIRSGELARVGAKLDALSPAERRAVEAVTAQIVNKLLHAPTVRMKAAAGADGSRYASAVRHLFALEDVA